MAFIEEQAESDTNRLLLDAARYPEIDIPFVVDQILSRKKIREKLPSWYANKALVFPTSLAAEQCSSERTALYKQRLIRPGEHVCDLTGGLGVDTFAFSRKARQVTYIERFERYADTARTNFQTLGSANITVMQGDGTELVSSLVGIDTFYLDPARRGEGNKRVFALSDCEPDLTLLLPRLFERAPRVIVKISPMADIDHTLTLLPDTTEVHVVAVRNECKELLFVMERSMKRKEVPIVCAHLKSGNDEDCFVFTTSEERTIVPVYAQKPENYLYEPNASLLKAGAFKLLTERYPVRKIQVNSHLYTSNRLILDFPGRIFCVEAVLPFSSSLAKRIAKEIPQANITVRNFPLSAEALRIKTRIKDGGNTYLFATTLSDGERVLIQTKKG
ncbi:MAG: SAM-dependent methyltransferase [Massilibacteroides sp.]|nr:SAM-dependent methyltransferase [Massilibacteroides sp.]MDD4116205.1 SAM-dependent methyltransferase [Massilibacteroides sp.]MDD4660143.1 SAM-dependent methyltransferase [Massilibacteroides sp.]